MPGLEGSRDGWKVGSRRVPGLWAHHAGPSHTVAVWKHPGPGLGTDELWLVWGRQEIALVQRDREEPHGVILAWA